MLLRDQTYPLIQGHFSAIIDIRHSYSLYSKHSFQLLHGLLNRYICSTHILKPGIYSVSSLNIMPKYQIKYISCFICNEKTGEMTLFLNHNTIHVEFSLYYMC